MSAKSLVALLSAALVAVAVWYYGFSDRDHHIAYDSTMGILLEKALQTEVAYNESIGIKPAEDMVLVPIRKKLKDGPCGYYTDDNGEYCTGTDKLYMGEWAMQQVYGAAGIIGVFAMAGHENGHHISAMRGLLSNSQDFYTKRSGELQADCHSGAFVMFAYTIGMTDNPRTADLGSLFALIGSRQGDYHGTPEEREAAFRLGMDQGMAVC